MISGHNLDTGILFDFFKVTTKIAILKVSKISLKWFWRHKIIKTLKEASLIRSI